MKEQPYFDQTGKEIKEFALLRFFHFVGARKKKHYMYKWVNVVMGKYVALHLENSSGDHFHLRGQADENRIIADALILQQPEDYQPISNT